MIVNRHRQNETPPKMTIYLRNGDAGSVDGAPSSQPASSTANLSKAQPPTPQERVVELDMQNKHSSQILEYFLAETRAVPLRPTEAEKTEMQELAALKVQSEASRARMRARRAEIKREQDMLRRSREAGGMSMDDDA
jgi:large subunit ribosomal protein MRP49